MFVTVLNHVAYQCLANAPLNHQVLNATQEVEEMKKSISAAFETNTRLAR